MAWFLTDEEVRRLLPMSAALAAVEEALREHGEGRADNIARRRARGRGGLLHVMAAALPAAGAMGLKAYTTFPGRASFVVLLWSADTGELEAVLQADALGQIRTGAASGVATRFLARPDADTLGIVGTGYQARTQVEAIAAVRRLREVRAYSRDPERRATFAREMSEKLGVPVRAVESAEAAVRDAAIVVTATNAQQPVVSGAWLAEGCHVNATGSNRATHRELDDEAVRRAARIVVDSREAASLESGDLLPGIQAGWLRWEEIDELGAVVAGRAPGRPDATAITLFKSHGIALEDVAVAAYVLRQARARGIGQELPQL